MQGIERAGESKRITGLFHFQKSNPGVRFLYFPHVII